MRIIGLTGSSGSGKSLIAKYFGEHGCAIIDADLVSHTVTNSNTSCQQDLSLAFGEDLIRPDGTLDRVRLAAIVFSDQEKLETLNKIVLPYILEEIGKRISELKQAGYHMLLLDAPTLFEAGADSICDFIIAVCADPEIKLKRIMERDKLSIEAASMRMGAQKDDSFYHAHANLVLYNDKSQEELFQKVSVVFKELLKQFDIKSL